MGWGRLSEWLRGALLPAGLKPRQPSKRDAELRAVHLNLGNSRLWAVFYVGVMSPGTISGCPAEDNVPNTQGKSSTDPISPAQLAGAGSKPPTSNITV